MTLCPPRLLPLLSLIFASWLAPVAEADEGMISPVDAGRVGLVVQWFSQLEVSDASALVDVALVIDENRATTFFEVAGGRLREIISEHDLSPFGEPFGVEGAAAFAAIRQEIMQARLKRDLKEDAVTVEKVTVPYTTLYTISRTGQLNSIDAESGELRWRVDVGSREYPTIGLGASKTHLAVVNGSSVYCLDASNGKTMWSKNLAEGVSGSPVVNEHFIFVPTSEGRLEAIPLDSKGTGRTVYVAVGKPATSLSPLLEGTSVAWPTDRGLTVAPADEIGSMRFRVRSDSPVEAQPVSHAGVFYVASREGFIYAVAEATGALLWDFPTGERIRKAPVPLGDDLFVITENNHLHKFDARTGDSSEGWDRPLEGIRQFVGASETRIYVLSTLGQLVALDRKSGSSVGAVSDSLSLRSFTNRQTDRIYVCHSSGLVQCLRETGSPRPMFHTGDWTELASTQEPGEAAEAGRDPSPGDNPFGQPDNPFGGDSNPPANSDDPFGGSSNAPSAATGDDPFGGSGAPATGGGADPFGGSGGAADPAAGGDADPFGGAGNMNSGAAGGDADPFAAGNAGGDQPSGAPAEDPEQPAESEAQAVVWKDVEGLFRQNCGGCHGARNQKGGLDLSSFEATIRGGDSGSIVTAGDASASRLYLVMTHEDEPKMPPNGRKVGDPVLKKIKAWIDGGALETADAAGAAKDSGAASDTPASDGDPFGGG